MARPPLAERYLRVTEIFHSIQGESTWAGLPCTFVRLTGCPLRCVWCDTEYAFFGGEKLSLEDILRRVQEMGTGLVEVTGGEPLVRKGVTRFLSELAALDGVKDLSLTTNGVLLADMAHDLKAAGLSRVTVSRRSIPGTSTPCT